MNGEVFLVCENCGGEIPEHFPSGQRRSPSHQAASAHHFCSRSCKAGYYFADRYDDGFGIRKGQIRHNIRGELHPRWRGGVSPLRSSEMARSEYKNWRSEVFERDNYTCVECGLRGGRIQAHHIKPYSEYPDQRLDVANGVTLCDDCHRDVHRRHAITRAE